MTASSPAMTVQQARARYTPERPDDWHTQPVCTCGEYISQHSARLPHPCLVCRYRPKRCPAYQYARMGQGEAG